MVDTSDEWIVQRTGIKQRHIASRRDDRVAGRGGGARRARQCRVDAGRHRSDRARHVDAQQHVSRRPPSTSRTASACARLRLRHAGGVQRLRLRRVDGRPLHSRRHGEARAGDRRGDLLAHSRLEDRTTCVLFGDGAGAIVLEAAEGEGTIADRASWPPACAPTARTRTSSMSTAARRRPDGRPSAHGRPRGLQACGGHDHRRHRGDFGSPAGIRRDHRLVRAAPGQQAHHRRFGQEAGHCRREGGHDRRPHGNTSAASVPLALPSPSPTAASNAAISFCSKRWAAASPGARCCCAGRRGGRAVPSLTCRFKTS
jgi:3-oxoacyl-[acyl-carrier-protein] synthase-3